jgi:DNA-binding response OmpR family regulator
LTDRIRSITVLVVDDEKAIRELLGDTLSAVGYKSLTAGDYERAIHIMKTESIDVVITDVLLPGRSGIELIEYIKRNLAQIPVLAISGKHITEKEVLNAGAG